MNIGKPKRTIQVEPIETPVPSEVPLPAEEPTAPTHEPVEEPAPSGSAGVA